MMKTLCYSVRLQMLVDISDKACKAIAFDGSEAILPKSQIFGSDYEVVKSEAYWISAWILKQKNLQYSTKKSAYFDENGRKLPSVTVEHHVPQKEDKLSHNEIKDLER